MDDPQGASYTIVTSWPIPRDLLPPEREDAWREWFARAVDIAIQQAGGRDNIAGPLAVALEGLDHDYTNQSPPRWLRVEIPVKSRVAKVID